MKTLLIAMALVFLTNGCGYEQAYVPMNATVVEPGDSLRIKLQNGQTHLVRFHDPSGIGLKTGDQISIICYLDIAYCRDALLGWDRYEKSQ